MTVLSRLVAARSRVFSLSLNRNLDSNMEEIVRGASVAFVLKAIGAGLSFVFNVVLARLLGAEEAGLYFLALTCTMIATILGRAGLDNTLLRFVAAETDAGDWVAVKGVYRTGTITALAASSFTSLMLFTMASWLAETVFAKTELTEPLRWMALAVVPIVLLTLHAQMLQGLKRIRDSQLVHAVSIPALSILGVYLLGREWGVKGVVWAYTLAALITAVISYFIWRRATPQLQGITGKFEVHNLLRSSIPLLWVASTNLVMHWTGTFILGVYGASADVAIFSVASRTAIFTSFILTSINTVAGPQFAILYKRGDMKALASSARKCARLMALIASPVLFFLLVASKWVMGVFGQQFVEGSAVLIILAITQFFNSAAGSVGPMLMMTGNERSVRNSVFAGAISNIVLSVILIPSFGIIGAAIGSAFSLILVNGICLYAIKKHLGISYW